jgi:hypothetical protein
MKMFSRILSVLVITSLGLMYTGCGGGDDKEDPAEKVQLGKLSSTWNVNTVTLDGVDRKSDFTGFKLTLGGTFDAANPKGPYNYSVSGTRPTPNPWPASGTWKFGSDVAKDLVRLDTPDQAMTYTVTDTSLSITFTYSGDGFTGGRTNQVSGTWVFTFTK